MLIFVYFHKVNASNIIHNISSYSFGNIDLESLNILLHEPSIHSFIVTNRNWKPIHFGRCPIGRVWIHSYLKCSQFFFFISSHFINFWPYFIWTMQLNIAPHTNEIVLNALHKLQLFNAQPYTRVSSEYCSRRKTTTEVKYCRQSSIVFVFRCDCVKREKGWMDRFEQEWQKTTAVYFSADCRYK